MQICGTLEMASDFDSNQKPELVESLDRISNLPAEVVDEILNLIPIRDAVKTCLLSKAWRYKWKSIPELVFDAESLTPSISGTGKDTTSVAFVGNVLSLHSGLFSKFELNKFLSHGCPDIDKWISLLSSKSSLNEFALVCNRCSQYQVPDCLYSCRKLRKLRLRHCELGLPPDCKGFSYLTHLRLCRTKVNGVAVETLVRSSIFLQYLSIRECSKFTSLTIDAPNLRRCNIKGSFKSIRFHNTSKVKYITLHKGFYWARKTYLLEEVLSQLLNNKIYRLSICYPLTELFSIGSAPRRLQSTYRHLNSVKLHLNFEDSKQIFAALCLFESAPYMKKLCIMVVHDRSTALFYEKHSWKSWLHKKKNIFRHLKHITLVEFKGVQRDLVFIRFILQNAIGLETANIIWKKNFHKEEGNIKLHVEEKLTQSKKASQEAKFIFCDQE